MTARGRKDARRIDAAFDHGAAGEPGGGNRRQGRYRPGDRERGPVEFGPPQSRRREAFRGALTGESVSQSISTPQQSPEEAQTFLSPDVNPVTAE